MNGISQNWQESFFMALNTVITNVVSYFPTILAAIVVFIVGIFLAGWAKKLVVKLLKAVKLPGLFKKSGLKELFDKSDIVLKIEEVVAEIVRWLILLLFSVTAINILGLTTVSQVLNRILGYIPRAISAVFILAIAVLAAGLVENVIKGSLAQVNIKTARLLSKVGSYLVVIFGVLAAINELGIAQTFVNAIFIGLIAALSLGFGLALGLGGKDLVKNLLEEWHKDLKKSSKK